MAKKSLAGEVRYGHLSDGEFETCYKASLEEAVKEAEEYFDSLDDEVYIIEVRLVKKLKYKFHVEDV